MGRLFVCVCAFGLAACGMSPKEQKAVSVGVDVALCVLQHSTEPITQIVVKCGASSEREVLEIFAAARAANKRGFSTLPPEDAGTDAGP